MICEYFLPFGRSAFHLVDGLLGRAEAFSFDVVPPTCLFLLLVLLLLVSDSKTSSPRPVSRLVTNNFFRKHRSRRIVTRAWEFVCTKRRPADQPPRTPSLLPLPPLTGHSEPPWPCQATIPRVTLRSPFPLLTPTQPRILGYPLPRPEPWAPADLGLGSISAFSLLPPGQKPIALSGPSPQPRLPPPRARPDELRAPGAAPPTRTATCPVPALVNWSTSLAEARLPQEAQ